MQSTHKVYKKAPKGKQREKETTNHSPIQNPSPKNLERNKNREFPYNVLAGKPSLLSAI